MASHDGERYGRHCLAKRCSLAEPIPPPPQIPSLKSTKVKCQPTPPAGLRRLRPLPVCQISTAQQDCSMPSDVLAPHLSKRSFLPRLGFSIPFPEANRELGFGIRGGVRYYGARIARYRAQVIWDGFNSRLSAICPLSDGRGPDRCAERRAADSGSNSTIVRNANRCIYYGAWSNQSWISSGAETDR